MTVLQTVRHDAQTPILTRVYVSLKSPLPTICPLTFVVCPLIWPPSSPPGPSCPTRSRPASWRWSRPSSRRGIAVEPRTGFAQSVDSAGSGERKKLGGLGSGHWYRSDSKRTVEGQKSIDVRWMVREGLIKRGVWRRG